MNQKMHNMQQLLLRIPRGKVTTYRELALALGMPRGFRAAGQMLGKNPDPEKYPCYKVVRSDGGLGGFALGLPDKVRRLRADGVEVRGEKVADLAKIFYRFS